MTCEEIGWIIAAILVFGCLIWLFVGHGLKQRELMEEAEKKAEEYRKQDKERTTKYSEYHAPPKREDSPPLPMPCSGEGKEAE